MLNKTTHCSREFGYVALLSTIIIGAVLLVMTIEVGQSGWRTRFMILGAEAKAQSQQLALACAHRSVALVMSNIAWSGNATTTSTIGSCYVFPIEKNVPNAGEMTLRVQAIVRASVTNIILEYDMAEMYLMSEPLSVGVPLLSAPPLLVPQLVSWHEVAVLP